ncbi:uncharacterized protein I303_105102 [Kwoniella dejecticola CBS 10117]|uniref:Uncharacterized protein n=1 Tax=Kwoniella dejecticola CBS 10117 TaxID=1296121 RepID=A0A1A6A3G9_9TREE|nr:uncharacterized protein I303_05453 [Kwoniella dejecticola CBS 10117]OBR84594.1 hypothetical protein I303_05453 [Kwoniella dejecticola CBS 10117]
MNPSSPNSHSNLNSNSKPTRQLSSSFRHPLPPRPSSSSAHAAHLRPSSCSSDNASRKPDDATTTASSTSPSAARSSARLLQQALKQVQVNKHGQTDQAPGLISTRPMRLPLPSQSTFLSMSNGNPSTDQSSRGADPLAPSPVPATATVPALSSSNHESNNINQGKVSKMTGNGNVVPGLPAIGSRERREAIWETYSTEQLGTFVKDGRNGIRRECSPDNWSAMVNVYLRRQIADVGKSSNTSGPDPNTCSGSPARQRTKTKPKTPTTTTTTTEVTFDATAPSLSSSFSASQIVASGEHVATSKSPASSASSSSQLASRGGNGQGPTQSADGSSSTSATATSMFGSSLSVPKPKTNIHKPTLDVNRMPRKPKIRTPDSNGCTTTPQQSGTTRPSTDQLQNALGRNTLGSARYRTLNVAAAASLGPVDDSDLSMATLLPLAPSPNDASTPANNLSTSQVASSLASPTRINPRKRRLEIVSPKDQSSKRAKFTATSNDADAASSRMAMGVIDLTMDDSEEEDADPTDIRNLGIARELVVERVAPERFSPDRNDQTLRSSRNRIDVHDPLSPIIMRRAPGEGLGARDLGGRLNQIWQIACNGLDDYWKTRLPNTRDGGPDCVGSDIWKSRLAKLRSKRRTASQTHRHIDYPHKRRLPFLKRNIRVGTRGIALTRFPYLADYITKSSLVSSPPGFARFWDNWTEREGNIHTCREDRFLMIKFGRFRPIAPVINVEDRPDSVRIEVFRDNSETSILSIDMSLDDRLEIRPSGFKIPIPYLTQSNRQHQARVPSSRMIPGTGLKMTAKFYANGVLWSEPFQSDTSVMTQPNGNGAFSINGGFSLSNETGHVLKLEPEPTWAFDPAQILPPLPVKLCKNVSSSSRPQLLFDDPAKVIESISGLTRKDFRAFGREEDIATYLAVVSEGNFRVDIYRRGGTHPSRHYSATFHFMPLAAAASSGPSDTASSDDSRPRIAQDDSQRQGHVKIHVRKLQVASLSEPPENGETDQLRQQSVAHAEKIDATVRLGEGRSSLASRIIKSLDDPIRPTRRVASTTIVQMDDETRDLTISNREIATFEIPTAPLPGVSDPIHDDHLMATPMETDNVGIHDASEPYSDGQYADDGDVFMGSAVTSQRDPTKETQLYTSSSLRALARTLPVGNSTIPGSPHLLLSNLEARTDEFLLKSHMIPPPSTAIQLEPQEVDQLIPTSNGLVGPIMKNRVNGYTKWSTRIDPGTLADLFPALDEVWDGGKIRHLIRDHEESVVWTRYHLSEKQRFMACCWNRWVYQKGPIPAVRRSEYYCSYIRTYGPVMVRARLFREVGDTLHVFWRDKFISIKEMGQALKLWNEISGYHDALRKARGDTVITA